MTVIVEHAFVLRDPDSTEWQNWCAGCGHPRGEHRTVTGRRVSSIDGLTRPGDYFGPVSGHTGDRPAVMFLKSNARDIGANARARSVQHVCSPPHTFRECGDGSLEIRASIGNLERGDKTGRTDDGWHGWLDEGHMWRLA